MNVSTLLRYCGLLLVGMMAGSSFAFVLGMGPAMEQLSITSYMEFHRSMETPFNIFSPLIYLLAIATLLASLYQIRQSWKSMEFLLIAFALLCVVDELLMTRFGNLPLNHVISQWDLIAPPPDWMEIRSQWLRFMYIRSALLVSGFALLLASTFFMKRSPASPQDVFAVA